MRNKRFQSLFLTLVSALWVLGLTGIAPALADIWDMPDCNGDGRVNDDDLSVLLSEWGNEDTWGPWWDPCPPVNDDDLSLLLANWTGPIHVTHARPQHTTECVKIGTVEMEGAPYHLWEMRVTTQSDWTNTRLDLTLIEGSIGQHEFGGRGPPSRPLVAAFPELTYDTYVQAPAGWEPGTAPEVVMTDTAIGISWFDTANTGAGTFKIGQIALSPDAAGRATGKSYEIYTAGVGVPFAFTIVDGTSPIPGDADLSGCVDDDDLSIVLARGWGSTNATWVTGDFTGDGCVDDDDLCLVLVNWTGPCETIHLVPEPATLSLLAVGALVLVRRRALWGKNRYPSFG